MIEIILIQGFCQLKIKITQRYDGLHLKTLRVIFHWLSVTN